MKTQIIFLDLDGTLLDDSKALSSANRAALERCAAHGVHIVPATGRYYAAIPEAVRTLPFVRYVIAVNGAQIYDAAERKVLHRAELPLDTALRVYDRLDTLPVIYECYLKDRGYMPDVFYAQIDRFISDAYIRNMVRSLREPVNDFRAFLLRQNSALQKIQMFFRDAQARQKALAFLPREFPETAVSSSMPGAVEITDRSATKGEALRFLCRYLNVENTLAFGDSSNDLSMIKAAGVGIAMANADASLRDAADYVTDFNYRDGVAKALERFFP